MWKIKEIGKYGAVGKIDEEKKTLFWENKNFNYKIWIAFFRK